MKRYALVAAFTLVMGCAQVEGNVASAGARQLEPGKTAVPQRSAIVPLGDHHVHLVGPYALPLPDPLLPEVRLPAELTRLLEDRGRLVGNVTGPADLEKVFTEDAQLLNAYIAPTAWYRDKFWFERYLNLGTKGRSSRFVPNQYHLSGDSGFIAGTVLDEPSKTHAQNFLLAVRKGRDGRWRIAADSTTQKTPHRFTRPLTADGLIRELDEAGIKRATVLSVAFWLGSSGGGAKTRRMTEMPTEAAAVRAENEWTAQQVARFPDRLVLACAVNPLKEYAIAELEHCARGLNAKGMKLNFGDSGVSFDIPDHMEKIRRFFRAANENKIAIIVHLEPGRFYGPREVEMFLDIVASASPEITIQLAHMAGNGPGITSPEALAAFAEARQKGDPRTRNFYFDFAGLIYKNMPKAAAELMAARMRQIGLDRILYASDSAPGFVGGNPPTADQWEWTRRQLPLTDAELNVIALNVPPYMR